MAQGMARHETPRRWAWAEHTPSIVECATQTARWLLRIEGRSEGCLREELGSRSTDRPGSTCAGTGSARATGGASCATTKNQWNIARICGERKTQAGGDMTSDGEARVLRIGTAILAAMLAAGVVQAQQRVVRDPAERPTQLPKTKAPARMMRGVARQSVDTKSMVELIDELVACGTRLTLSSWTDAKRGAGCGRDKIKARFDKIAEASGGKLQVIVDEFEATAERTSGQPVPLQNVYAILPGADPVMAKTVLVVSGHFDSRPSDVMDPNADAPGADDDASGTAVSVECARVLSKLAASGKSGLRATILFAAVSGEEQGLLGSGHLVEWLKEKGYTIGGMLDDDIVGADPSQGAPHRVRVFSGNGEIEDADSPSRELARAVEEINGRDAIRMIFRVDRYGRGGDHYPFYKAGLPAVRFTEPQEDYNHQHQTPRTENGVEYGDFAKYLNAAFLGNVARYNAEALRQLAMAPAAPTEVRLTGAVTPDAKLSWKADEDPE